MDPRKMTSSAVAKGGTTSVNQSVAANTSRLAMLTEQYRQLVARDGLRALAFVATHDRGHAEREGLRLVEFLRAVGLTLEPDPTPSIEDPDALDRTAPPTSPNEIGEPVLTPARLAAAAKRVRWRVVHAG